MRSLWDDSEIKTIVGRGVSPADGEGKFQFSRGYVLDIARGGRLCYQDGSGFDNQTGDPITIGNHEHECGGFRRNDTPAGGFTESGFDIRTDGKAIPARRGDEHDG